MARTACPKRITSATPVTRRKGTRFIRLAITVAALGVACFAPASAEAIRSEFYGIAQGSTLDNRDLTGMVNARVRTDRFLLNWGLVQPASKASFNWGPTDDFIGALASHAIRPVPFVWGSPEWISGNPATPPIDTAARRQAWVGFLKAAVARYGNGGVYWANRYHRDYGANARPLPVQSWQIWNEPNLTKFFAPTPSPTKYARLVQISHDAIKSQSPQANVVLAGLPGDAWDFLDSFYSVSGIKADFDTVALHPYGSDVSTMALRIRRSRDVMRNHLDQSTPLWITEFAWGSAPPDRFGINQGPAGQAKMLRASFDRILEHRPSWNVQRLFWYHWRDPRDQVATCSFCASAGLLHYDYTAKPALAAFRSFAAETISPQATITSGPGNGSFIGNPTPTFSFVSSQAGSTFECRTHVTSFKSCRSPYKLPHLANGPHEFSLRAIDAAGNVSGVQTRSFTVDTVPPRIPTITGTAPASPANDNLPEVIGTADPASTVAVYTTAGCTGSQPAKDTAARFKSPGITAYAPDNSTTTFRAQAIDRAGNKSGCSAGLAYVEDSTP
jgi:hypothetical protein